MAISIEEIQELQRAEHQLAMSHQATKVRPIDWKGISDTTMGVLRQAQQFPFRMFTKAMVNAQAITQDPSRLDPRGLSAQEALDSAAMATAPVPVLGDVTGIAAQGYATYQDPSALNKSLLGLEVALPFGAGAGILRGAFSAGSDPKLLGTYQDAISMEEAGLDPSTIWARTGWWNDTRSGTGWRLELDDSKSSIRYGVLDRMIADIETYERATQSGVRQIPPSMQRNLSEILDFPELFEAYPQLRQVKVEPDLGRLFDMPEELQLQPGQNVGGNARAWYNEITEQGRIQISAYRGDPFHSTLLHEVQHLVQHLDGIPTGGSPVKWSLDSVTNINKAITEARVRNTTALRYLDVLQKHPDVADFPDLVDTLDGPRILAMLQEEAETLGDINLDAAYTAYRTLIGGPTARGQVQRGLTDIAQIEEYTNDLLKAADGKDERLRSILHAEYERLWGEQEARNVEWRFLSRRANLEMMQDPALGEDFLYPIQDPGQSRLEMLDFENRRIEQRVPGFTPSRGLMFSQAEKMRLLGDKITAVQPKPSDRKAVREFFKVEE